MSEELVFVGGPMDGFRNKYNGSYTHVTVPTMTDMRLTDQGDPPVSVPAFENVTYRRERIAFGPSHIDFLVAADLTAEQAVQKVFDRYSTRKLS